jgi:hypothetical protein
MTSPQSRPVPVSTICSRNGETFRIGALDVKALYTPGHTPADMSYMLEDAVFAGDTLFMPDYGTARCDFPGGDARTLYRSAARPMEGPGPKHIDRQDQHPGATDIGCESVWRQVIHGTTFLVLFATRLL